MSEIYNEVLNRANEAAIYNLYLYLAHKTTPAEGASLRAIAAGLNFAEKSGANWDKADKYRLKVLNNAVNRDFFLGNAKLGELIRSNRGLTACTFINKDGEVFVCFKGTGGGEWIDNGEGLSGVSETNTYIIYGKDGKERFRRTVRDDFASDQQVEALNWFDRICAKNNWNEQTKIYVSGHSKGGNKAQFITLNSDMVTQCFSFNGQGFSPEAIREFKKKYAEKFDERTRKIYGFAAQDDYVNVLGKQVVPIRQQFFLESSFGIHFLEWMMDENGKLNNRCEQGELSQYAEKLSNDLMSLPPQIRQHATLGIMNVFQKYLAKQPAINNDRVSTSQTIAGLGIAAASVLYRFFDNKNER